LNLSGIGDGNLNLDTGFNVDGGDLLDDLGGAVEVDHSLVDPHLELVPGLGTLSARSLPGGDSQHLGGHPHRSLHLKLLVLGSPDEVAADLLQGLDVPGCQSDSDAVDGTLSGFTSAITSATLLLPGPLKHNILFSCRLASTTDSSLAWSWS